MTQHNSITNNMGEEALSRKSKVVWVLFCRFVLFLFTLDICGFYFSIFLFCSVSCSVSCLYCIPGSANLTEETADIVGAAGIAMTGVVIPGCSQLAFVLPCWSAVSRAAVNLWQSAISCSFWTYFELLLGFFVENWIVELAIYVLSRFRSVQVLPGL